MASTAGDVDAAPGPELEARWSHGGMGMAAEAIAGPNGTAGRGMVVMAGSYGGTTADVEHCCSRGQVHPA